MLKKRFEGKNIILASQSPRRQNLLKELEIEFEIRTKDDIDESFPENMPDNEVAEYLANKKADAFITELKPDDILITADTIVILNGKVINKPEDKQDAIRMLNELSGNVHKVITGVCISTVDKRKSFSAHTDVYFRKLTDEEILHYIDKYKPYDKAGAYGIQEWIGYIAIKRIEGSYFNVMGLPIQKLYDELMLF